MLFPSSMIYDWVGGEIVEIILTRTIYAKKLALINPLKCIVDWPYIPRVGEYVSIEPFEEEHEYEFECELIMVSRVIHDFKKDRIEVELVTYEMPDAKTKTPINNLVNKCREHGWINYFD